MARADAQSRPEPSGDAVVGKAASVCTIEVEPEALLLDEATGRVQVLNAAAALLWACLDGTSSLGEICADLADGLGAPYSTVLADTITVVRELLDEGFAVDTLAPALPNPDTAPEDLRLEPLGPLTHPLGDIGTAVLTVDLSDQLVQIRSNDADAIGLLRRALAPLASNAGPATVELSLLVGQPRGRIAPLHALYRGPTQVLATRPGPRCYARRSSAPRTPLASKTPSSPGSTTSRWSNEARTTSERSASSPPTSPNAPGRSCTDRCPM